MEYQYPLTDEEKELIYETRVDPTAPSGAIKTFFHQIQRTGLDPLNNQIHLVCTSKDKNLWSVMIGIDGSRLIANRTGAYAGSDKAVHTYDENGNLTVSEVTVRKIVQGMKCSFTSEAYWAEYFPGERKGFMWNKMPHVMLPKTAEAQALRKAFPQELSGLYTAEELDQARPAEASGGSDTPDVPERPEKPQPELEEGVAYAGTVFTFKPREGKNPAIIGIEHDGSVYNLSTFNHPEGMPWELIQDAVAEQLPCQFTVTKRTSKGTTYTNLNVLVLVDTTTHPERDELEALVGEIAQHESIGPSVVLASFGVMDIDELSVADCHEIAPLMRKRINSGQPRDNGSAEEAVSS